MANGRHKKEILLSSVPAEVQERYLKKQQAAVSEQRIEDGGSKMEDSAILDPQSSIIDVSEEELEEVNRRAEVVKEASGEPRSRRAQIAWKARISLTTLDRRLKSFRAEGIKGLTRKPREDDGVHRKYDAQVTALIQSHYLNPHRPMIAAVHRWVSKDCEMSGVPPPNYTWVRRVVEKIPADMIARFREGDKTFRDKFAYVTLRKKPALPRQWVNSDHHQCDHFVIFPDGKIGRPWLTAIQDICTNEIMGFYIKREVRAGRVAHPGSNEVALCLRRAVLKKEDQGWPSFGLFENFYLDLGKDYRSHHVRAVCHDLGIHIEHCQPYHGQSKPIERWFGVMENALRHLPGYTGSKPELRPEGIDPKSLLSIDQYDRALHDWITKEYHYQSSKALGGLSPIEALGSHAKNGWSPREIGNDRALDLLLMRRRSVKVYRMGIQAFGVQGKQRYFWTDELTSYINQRVDIAYDPAHVGELLVYAKDRFVCKATNKELLTFGASEEMIAQERQIRRKQREDLNTRYGELQARAQYPDPLARAAAEQRYEKALGEEQKKIAVGAEPEGVPVLLPKYAQAAKKLRKKPVLVTRDRARGEGTNNEHDKRSPNPHLVEEPLPTSEEIFKTEKNPWLEEDEE